ncbi:MAG TPA: adenylate/guanylate cyclase domain-containing protein [Solirubrobacterales bacterium]|nr:adenylate/guanylate cyclase domain-containing protein [Solirubrobacterales bacterium]
MAAKTRYAKSGDVSIAYQVVGDGPRDLLLAPGFVSHAEVLLENPDLARAFDRFASFARLITFDKREQGLSDRMGRAPTIEEMVDDMNAVLDAAGSERAAVVGISEGGAMALMFAATHPERTTHLVIWGGYARVTQAPDYEYGFPSEYLDRWTDQLNREWGGPVALEMFAPSRAGDPETQRWWAHLLRSGTSPRSVRALMDLYKELDVRHVLPVISAPTLILHRKEDRVVPIEQGRYLAENIPGARWIEFPGADHLLFTQDGDEIAGEIEEFITGTRQARPPERVLATVLFTDIVDSTAHAARLGDQGWRELLDRHDNLARSHVSRYQGQLVKTTGDGILATFDGPARAIECGAGIVRGVQPLGIEVRAGLHSGECERRNGDVGGMAVHIGARVAARAEGGEVLVSGTVKDLVVGSGIEFDDRGSATLKGVPGEWRLYRVKPT